MDYPKPDLPQTMRAMTMRGFGPPEVIEARDVALPPRRLDTDVLIETHAAGVNPFETKLRRGWLAPIFPAVGEGHVLGSDVSGILVEKGFDVSDLDLEVGDRVWGVTDAMRWGSYAEYTASDSYRIRRAPKNLSFEEAAAVPMAGSTAWWALVNLARIEPGMRVLIHAGAGGVGGFAVQIAKHFGAWVAATASAAKTEYVRSLGADDVIDYQAGDFRDLVSDIDIVLDPIGGETNLRSYEVLRPGGTLLVVLRGDQVEMANRERLMKKHDVITKVVAFSAAPDALDRLRELFEDGSLKPPRIEVLPLAQASEAHRRIESGHTLGKIILKVR